MKILIKNGRVIDPLLDMDETSDIVICEGKVLEIGKNLTTKVDKIIDASGYWVTPGLIDMHVHFREPGYEHKETIQTGSDAALAGGFTSVCTMPNTKPVSDCANIISHIKREEKRVDGVHIFPSGSVTKGQEGLELSDIEEMVLAGAVAISEDGKSVANSYLMKKALSLCAKLNIPMLSHCEDIYLVNKGCMNEGVHAETLGLGGISNDMEDVMIARDIILAASTSAKLHICHLSTENGVRLVKEAKERKEKVTAEAAPHHFILNDTDIDGTNANFKMNPPLRSKKDVSAIIEGLRNDTIDVIATDHAPHHESEKNIAFEKALNGIIGLETCFSLCLSELIQKNILTPIQLIKKLTINPAKILGISNTKGSLAKGYDADITIIDPNYKYTINTETFKSKSKNSPFVGREVTGKVVMTIVLGEIKYNTREDA